MLSEYLACSLQRTSPVSFFLVGRVLPRCLSHTHPHPLTHTLFWICHVSSSHCLVRWQLLFTLSVTPHVYVQNGLLSLQSIGMAPSSFAVTHFQTMHWVAKGHAQPVALFKFPSSTRLCHGNKTQFCWLEVGKTEALGLSQFVLE